MVLDHEFPPDIRVENEIESLISAGHDVHVACFTFKNLPEKDQYLGASIHRKAISRLIHKTSVGALKFPFYFNFWRSFLNGLFEDIHFDAIHIHDLPLAKVGYEFAKKNEIKLTIDLHENWPAMLRIATHTNTFIGRLLSDNSQWVRYEKKYCELANNIIVVVEEAKDRLISLGISEEKIKVVSNTLNTNHFDLTDEQPDPKYFTLLYAGGINIHRGLQYVIRGLKFLKDVKPLVRLQILGSGSYSEELKMLTNKEEVSDMVEFTGWMKYKDMVKYVGRSDVCLIPHVKNDHTDSTIPHKIFQYMYAGKPIIASNCSPIERIINATKSGLVYEFDDSKAFSDCVRKLVDDTGLCQTLVSSGKKNVLNDYIWDIDSEILNQIYSG